MSTVHYPEVASPLGRASVSTELGMFVDGEREMDAVNVSSLRAEAAQWHSADDIKDRVQGLLKRFESAL